MADREQANPLPMADRERRRSQGRSEEHENLLPQNRRIRPELAGRFSLSRDVVAACFRSALLRHAMANALFTLPLFGGQ